MNDQIQAIVEELSLAECIVIRRLGQLVGYESRTHRYFQDARGRWFKVAKAARLRRSKSDRGRHISDWDLGNERVLSRGYRLTSVSVAEAESKLERA